MLKQVLDTLRGITEYASNEHAKAEARLLLKDLERVVEDHKDMADEYITEEAKAGAHAVFRMMGLEQ